MHGMGRGQCPDRPWRLVFRNRLDWAFWMCPFSQPLEFRRHIASAWANWSKGHDVVSPAWFYIRQPPPISPVCRGQGTTLLKMIAFLSLRISQTTTECSIWQRIYGNLVTFPKWFALVGWHTKTNPPVLRPTQTPTISLFPIHRRNSVKAV